MRQACPSVFVRFFPRPAGDPSRKRRLRRILALAFCIAGLLSTPLSGYADGADEGYVTAGEGTTWITPKARERREKNNGSAAYTALAPAERLTWIAPSFTPKRTLGGFRKQIEAGAITLRRSTPTGCLPGDLKDVLAEVARRFGTVTINSTHRTPQRNRRVGGAGKSLHLSCRAIDFRVNGRGRDVMTFLNNHKSVGGLKMYRNGVIHIDNGARRTW